MNTRRALNNQRAQAAAAAPGGWESSSAAAAGCERARGGRSHRSYSWRALRWVAVIWLVTAPRLGEAKPGDCQGSIRPLETPRCLGSAPAAQHDSGSSFDRQGCGPALGE